MLQRIFTKYSNTDYGIIFLKWIDRTRSHNYNH